MTTHSPYAVAKLPLLLLAVAVLFASIVSNAHYSPEDETNDSEPKVSVGILRRAKSCAPADKVALHSVVTVDVRLFTDESKEKRVEVFHSDNKVIPGVGKVATIPGLEMGVLGACVGEVRSIRIPADLGFGQLGHKKMHVPPDMPLRAKVEIKSVEHRTAEEDDAEPLHPDPDFTEDISEDNPMSNTAGRQPPTEVAFPDEVKQLTDKTFDDETKDKDAFVMIHATWCQHCIAFKPSFAKVVKAFAEQTDVVMAAVDGEANEKISSRFNVQGFPTIFLLRASGKKVPYEGQRDARSVIEFLNKELNKNVVMDS